MAKAALPTLREVNYGPSNSQLAVAVASVLLFGTYKRQMISVPSGKGKSRIVKAIAEMFRSQKKLMKRIVIAFSSKILYDTD